MNGIIRWFSIPENCVCFRMDFASSNRWSDDCKIVMTSSSCTISLISGLTEKSITLLTVEGKWIMFTDFCLPNIQLSISGMLVFLIIPKQKLSSLEKFETLEYSDLAERMEQSVAVVDNFWLCRWKSTVSKATASGIPILQRLKNGLMHQCRFSFLFVPQSGFISLRQPRVT